MSQYKAPKTAIDLEIASENVDNIETSPEKVTSRSIKSRFFEVDIDFKAPK